MRLTVNQFGTFPDIFGTPLILKNRGARYFPKETSPRKKSRGYTPRAQSHLQIKENHLPHTTKTDIITCGSRDIRAAKGDPHVKRVNSKIHPATRENFQYYHTHQNTTPIHFPPYRTNRNRSQDTADRDGIFNTVAVVRAVSIYGIPSGVFSADQPPARCFFPLRLSRAERFPAHSAYALAAYQLT